MGRDDTTDHAMGVALRRDGFAFVPAAAMRARLAAIGSLGDWADFTASWDDLAFDHYLADHGRYRRRRHAVFTVPRDGAPVHEAHQPHYQSREYNALQGGIERWFEPIKDPIAAGASLQTILRLSRALFGGLSPKVNEWRAEVHQFRIEARVGEPGQPTPEGVHRDGVDYVLVLMIGRVNIASGTTEIYSAVDHRLLGSFTLERAFDAALVEDARVFHGVTPVEALDPAKPAHRDVLVVTFKRR